MYLCWLLLLEPTWPRIIKEGGHICTSDTDAEGPHPVIPLRCKSGIFVFRPLKPKCKNPTSVPKGHNWVWSPRVCAAGADHPPRWFWAGLALATIINSQRYMTLEYYSFTRAWIELKFIKNWCGAKLRESVFLNIFKTKHNRPYVAS